MTLNQIIKNKKTSIIFFIRMVSAAEYPNIFNNRLFALSEKLVDCVMSFRNILLLFFLIATKIKNITSVSWRWEEVCIPFPMQFLELDHGLRMV